MLTNADIANTISSGSRNPVFSIRDPGWKHQSSGSRTQFLGTSGSRTQFLGSSGSRTRFLGSSGSRTQFLGSSGSRMRFFRNPGSRPLLIEQSGTPRGMPVRPIVVSGVFCMYTRKLTVAHARRGQCHWRAGSGPSGTSSWMQADVRGFGHERAHQPGRDSPAASLTASSTCGMLAGQRDIDADANGTRLKSVCV